MSKLSSALVVATAVVWSGCVPRKYAKPPGDPEWGVRVTWHGHSCFTFQDSAGRVFLIDPFDQTVGYDPVWTKPDAALVTHDHFDHNYLRRGVSYELVESTGVHTVAGVEVTGVPGFHDDREGRRHGLTRFYAWEMGGLRFAHLGDVGQTTLSPEQRRALGDVDVLMVPVGGKTTVDAQQAAALARAIAPRAVVPMHYGNERVRFFEFDPVDGFLRLFKRVEKLPENSFHLRRDELSSEPAVYVPALPPAKN